MNITEIVLSIIFAVLTGFLIPLIQSKLGADKITEIERWTAIFVQAAEQIYKNGTGSEKKDFVMQSLLERFRMDIADADALIEAEVLRLKNLTIW